MIIRSIQVQEGFLDGLTIEFAEGLNAIIGARGTGKTSVIELLRFALGAQAYTSEVDQVANNHAISILGSGLVTVVVEEAGQTFEIHRSASDQGPRIPSGTPPFNSPILLSQSELEKLALDDAGRLRLIDDFRPAKTTQQDAIDAAQRLVASLTVEISDVSAELSDLVERQDLYRTVDAELVEASADQKKALASLKELEPASAELKTLDLTKAERSVQVATMNDAVASIKKWSTALTRTLQSAPTLPAWPPNAGGEDLLGQTRELLHEAVQHIEEATKSVKRSLDLLPTSIASSQERIREVEDLIRPLRKTLEDASKGAGELTKVVSSLTERVEQSKALAQRVKDVQNRLGLLHSERRKGLEDVESESAAVLDERNVVANNLNAQLGPLIHIGITQAGFQAVYSGELVRCLQGSGLRYNSLAPKIAESVSPRELAEAVERGDTTGLASKAGIDEDRASRVIAHLGSQSLSDMLNVCVDDQVRVSLLDGGESKDTSELSTGQRCTAILPVLLRHQERVLVMDQPEDNLDNAFIVETLVKAILARPKSSQLIVTTHNANIPVIGDAANVILLASTGRRGFVDAYGPLDEPNIVEAISRVMEGGREAFQRRAEFYGSTPSA